MTRPVSCPSLPYQPMVCHISHLVTLSDTTHLTVISAHMVKWRLTIHNLILSLTHISNICILREIWTIFNTLMSQICPQLTWLHMYCTPHTEYMHSSLKFTRACTVYDPQPNYVIYILVSDQPNDTSDESRLSRRSDLDPALAGLRRLTSVKSSHAEIFSAHSQRMSNQWIIRSCQHVQHSRQIKVSEQHSTSSVFTLSYSCLTAKHNSQNIVWKAKNIKNKKHCRYI